MRRFSTLLVLPMLALAATGTISQTFEFAPGDFVFDRVNGFDVVALPGQYTTSEPGEPCLPLAVHYLAIPPDAEVLGIRVLDISTRDLPGEYDVHPAQRAQAFSLPELQFVDPAPEAYASDKPYPAEVATFTRSGCMGGYRLAGIQVAPLIYVPARRHLQVVTRLTVEIRYERNVHTPYELDGSQVRLMAGVVEQAVANPHDVTRFAPRTRLTDDWLCDMMLVTSSSLADEFAPFVEWKTRNGIKTVVVTTDSIYSSYPGRDNQEKIRNCVIDYWQNHGLKWLLVGGDEPVVPVREGRIICEGMTGNIATDLYYGDLQYSWDSNNNNLFGEMTDSMDLFYDIFVGRAPVDNPSNIANFFAKCTTYTDDPDTAYLKSILFGSTMLFNPFHGRVINHMIAELYPTGWRFVHLEDPPSGAFRDSMSAGCQLGHVAAHGSQTSFSVMSISQVAGLSNGHRKLNFTSSIACNSGWFDGYECIAESLFNVRNGGCIANMFNSRYGYGYPPGFGPSEMLDLEWYRYLVLGAANQFGTLATLCKDHFQSLTMGQEVWRWCVYQLNLFGDPSLPVWTERPIDMTVIAPDQVMVGPQVVRIMVNDADAPLADARVCLMKGDETYARGWTNSQGWVELFISPTTTGDLSITVNAHNYYPARTTIPVTGSTGGPAVVFGGLRIDDTDGNGRLDPGETADLYLKLANLGASQAGNTNAGLRTTCPHLTLTDSTSAFGNIPAGDTVEGDAFTVTAQVSTPTGTIAELLFPVTANEGNWQAFTTTQIGETPPPKTLWADHDTGEVILSVTTMGSIGTLGPYREGTGMKYPRDAAYGSLYFTSFAAGNGPDYVVDRWYGQPHSTYNTDWRAIDTLHPVLPPQAADEEYQCTIDDGNHPTPKGLTVTQWSGASSDTGYRDFAVLEYVLTNNGGSAINDLHVGVFSDFDVNNQRTNRAFTDTDRRLAYMATSSSFSPTCGVKLLEPTVAANLSAIDSLVYRGVGMMTEAVKDSFLRGSISVPNPTQSKNWSVVVSAGPFNLAPGARTRVAFAIIGAESQNDMLAFADSAQSWYENEMPSGVSYMKHTVDDAPPGGNGDGIINPGETVNLPLWVCNRTDQNAEGVHGFMRKTSGDTFVTLIDTSHFFGTVAAGDSAWTGSEGYGFRVSMACTNNYQLPLVLAITDAPGSTYVSTLPLKVGAPQLVHSGVMCWDPPPGGNNNGKLDPGDEADIALGLANVGLGHAQDVTAKLRSGDARFEILDSAGFYGSVPAESTVYNVSNKFRVRADHSIPRETQVPCTLLVAGTDYSVTRVVMLEIGVLTNVDPVPDGPRTPAVYYAYDDCDTFYVHAPEFEWVDITGVGTRLTLSDDQTVQVNLPSTFGPFMFYGRPYDQLSICGNGWVAPGYSTSRDYTNHEIPNAADPTMMALVWDDLYPPYSNGVWHYHDEANHRFIVQYDSMPFYSARETPNWFQLVIYDTTMAAEDGNCRFKYQYLTADNYGSCTVGENDSTTTVGIQCLFDGTYHRAASQVTAGRAIMFTTDSVITGLADAGVTRIGRLWLRAAPNPVHRAGLISFGLPLAGQVRLAVHDITGRRVRTLVDDRLLAGRHSFNWNRKDDAGREVGAGIYLYRLETDHARLTRKAVVVH